MANLLRRFGFISLFLFGQISVLSAQQGTAGSFLRLGIGAEAKAMGDAYTALANGVESSYYNPAGLPFLPKKEVLLSFRALSLDRSFTFIGIGIPIEPKIEGKADGTIKGGFSLVWVRAGIGGIDGRNTDGVPTGDISNSENAFIFSFALRPASVLALGLSVKVLWNRFSDIGTDNESISASGVGFDFGASLKPVDWLSVGVVLKDLNSEYRWDSSDIFGEDGAVTNDKFPRNFRIGAAVELPQLKNVIFAVDYEQFYRKKFFTGRIGDRIHVGVEGRVMQNIALRGGYDDGSLTAGGGYTFAEKYRLGYAFRSAGNRAEEEHVFTWIFQF